MINTETEDVSSRCLLYGYMTIRIICLLRFDSCFTAFQLYKVSLSKRNCYYFALKVLN